MDLMKIRTASTFCGGLISPPPLSSSRGILRSSILPVRRAERTREVHALRYTQGGHAARRSGNRAVGPDRTATVSAKSVPVDLDRVQPGEEGVPAGLASRLQRLSGEETGPTEEFILFYTDETSDLAHKIADKGDHVTLGKVRWSYFDDGFPNLFVEDAHVLRNKHVAFLASFHNPAVIFQQLSVIYALPRMFVASFTLILPFFPTGTSERVEDEGEVATAASMARVLSAIPPSRGGPTSLVIYDIHALQERFYFGDSVLPYFQSAIPILKARLMSHPDLDTISIAYPDEGAWKRFHKQFADFDQLVCTKIRDGDKRYVRLKEGDAAGRHVIIVDDLVQSGGTLIQCHKVLASLGAAHVSAFVTHAVFPNRSFEKFVPEDPEVGATSGFAHFWTTDSCPQTVAHLEGRAPFEVLSLAESLSATLHL